MQKVILGFSGGVDSAAAALLLTRAGYDVRCVFLDVGVQGAEADARRTAEFLGLPLEVLDARCALEECVCRPFAEGYLRGETLNPCLLCNPAVKFRFLLERADAQGAEFIATGHYARLENGALYMGCPDKDQSYQFAMITRPQLSRLLLPLGGMEKPRVREIAAEAGIPIAHKPDSMDICFIPDHDYAAWIERRGFTPQPGPCVFHGEVIGRHEGIHRWTVGQRWGELHNGRRLYISRIIPETNTLETALWEDLFKAEITVRGMNWLIDPPQAPLRGRVRARHTRWETPDCTVFPGGNGTVRIVTDTPLRAPAKGQTAAIYDGERLLGGGFLEECF